MTHNRLTHSRKVAQVAQAIAQRLLAEKSSWGLIHELGGIDADVLGTATLAHDLDHPPFGQVGEITLAACAHPPRGPREPPVDRPGLPAEMAQVQRLLPGAGRFRHRSKVPHQFGAWQRLP
ncbi:HD domain-containing protein [Crossiella cryophila]|uniref:HD domain-containing protein n=1 Tax=Crossiella cryophila TaxID=43355 RepID=UPI001C870021|nr:HD domain-containing protein [Crossiella cryophila]